jgi:hypothetical protein
MYQFYEMFVRAAIGSLILNFSTHPRKKTSRLTTHPLSFLSSLCHRFLGFVDPRNCWPSSTIPSCWQETHHFLQSYFGHACNVSISMSPYHMKQNFPEILRFSDYMVLDFFFLDTMAYNQKSNSNSLQLLLTTWTLSCIQEMRHEYIRRFCVSSYDTRNGAFLYIRPLWTVDLLNILLHRFSGIGVIQTYFY